MKKLPAPYVCRDCEHPRYALVDLGQMSAEQRRCVECGGRLIPNPHMEVAS